MDELLESLAELVRTLGRLHNNNKGLLLKGDIDRLEKAKDILHKNANSDERGRLKPSDDASALPIPDVSESVCPICHGTGYYYYGGSFGGSTMTRQCFCRANVR